MERRTLWAIVLVLVAVGIAVAIGVNAYQAGLARGLAESAQVTPPPGVAPPPGPYPYYYGPYWHRPFGFGFFGFLFPLLFFLLIFFLLKGLFWRPWGWWGGPGRYGPGALEEWHRRAHESMKESGQKL